MSAKYSNKKRKKNNRKDRLLLTAIGVLSVILVALLAVAFWLKSQPLEPGPSTTAGTEQATGQAQSQNQTTAFEAEVTTAPTRPEEQNVFDLGSGVKITGFISYTGAFMEDRTDEVVTDVLAIQITNSGEEYIQTMDVTLTADETQAQFSLSTLFPGETVIVLEKNRMAYSTAPKFDQAQTSAVALFDKHPGMCQEKLEIQCLNGVINVKNISGEDITEDILIYYKNYVSGIYYGGITYRIRITGGLKADEIRQGTAAHYNPDNSTVVFVTCG